MPDNTTPLLDAIQKPADTRSLSQDQLRQLADELRAEIRSVREQTDRPFAVDILFATVASKVNEAVRYTDKVAAMVDVVFEERVPVLISGLGSPKDAVPTAKELGITVMSVVGAVRHAQKAVAHGVDAVLASGSDGGGHVGSIGTAALIPAVVLIIRYAGGYSWCWLSDSSHGPQGYSGRTWFVINHSGLQQVCTHPSCVSAARRWKSGKAARSDTDDADQAAAAQKTKRSVGFRARDDVVQEFGVPELGSRGGTEGGHDALGTRAADHSTADDRAQPQGMGDLVGLPCKADLPGLPDQLPTA